MKLREALVGTIGERGDLAMETNGKISYRMAGNQRLRWDQPLPPGFQGQPIITADRPNQPNAGMYANPRIIARDLDHKGKYDADTTPAGIDLPLALHHVIPWKHLWQFWDALIDQEYYVSCRAFLGILGIPMGTTKKAFEQIKKSKYNDAVNDFQTKLCWGSWNLVRGPQFRVSADQSQGHSGFDPGDAVDDLHWMAGKDAGRITKLVGIDAVLLKYIDQMPDESTVRGTINSWTALARESIVEFIPEMWTINRESPDYVPGGHHQAVHPTWWKRQR
jgi:hypothetical protein